MKILYSHRTRSADGQYVHIRELTNALSARGHELVMDGPGGAAQHEKRMDAGGGETRNFIPKALYESAEVAYSLPAYWRLNSLYKKTAPAILYQRYNLFYYSGAWLKRSTGIPLVLEVNAPLARERAKHGGLALKSFAKNCEREIWRAADIVLPVTNVLADDVRATGVPDEKIQVIQNGVSEDFLQERTGSEIREQYGLQNKLVLGFTGFVRDWHRVDRVIDFIANCDRDDVHFLLVGDGTARTSLEELARVKGVSDKVTITGAVQREDMPGHVAAFDIALQPAVTDYASPLKLFEYMALGKAIVAPAGANIKEVLTDGDDALLFKDDDASFMKSLSVLVENKELRNKLSIRARESLLKQDLTWDANARRVEKLAVQLLEMKR
ncbi:MAG: glycosyl transferase family 1 [Hyphococcus sp.]|nr:MAG: glycosyl transferase family 1 [Marinicaulis sp.]